ncbi:carcinoembryonic antigen-related cell adhesion molecule 5-like [Dromiciops gliroides]|uniref:carcinoembryonic antigen-related cell adhesion molecule 5-like n=1 Tax=Dromiciops gliroides TaxID=33562 RepID=UPI001CC55F55|nr:carcinoembryonic antigen-related cell adhesion molecule 5-like [Dromiciops gliroides]
MERPMEAPHSGGSPWKGLLITASILSCWIQPTSAQAVVPNPPYGTVGGNVTLDIQGFSGEPLSYSWFRKTADNSNRIAFYHVPSGVQTPADIREKIFSNGSLLIPGLTLNDTDLYIVQIVDSQSGLILAAQGQLTVYGPLLKPAIISSNMAPVENKDNVSLTCQSESQDVTSLWFINQRPPAGDRMELSSDNKTLTIIHVTREDQGPYECEIQNPVSVNRSDPFTLNIIYGPDPPTILPTDPHYPVGATLELSCSAVSNPPAQYTWFINGTQMVSTAHNVSIPNVSLNYTGTYTCNASNLVTGLSSTKDISITISEKPAKPSINANSTNIIENGSLVFTCSIENEGKNILWVFNNQPLSLNDRMNMSEDNQTLTIKSVKREDAGSYQCEVWNPISANRSDPLTLTVSYGPEHIMFVPNPESGEIEVKFKDPLTLVCQVESCPPALYEWQVNGTVNSDFSGNTIGIKNVSWEDSGKYTCLAKNNVTNLTISKDIIVKVNADKSTGGGNGSTLSGGATAGIVIGVLAGVALIGALIYFLFFRDTGRVSKHHLSEEKHSAPKHGGDPTVYENTAFPRASALPAQGLGSSSASPEVLYDSPYQKLDITRVAIYDKIPPWKNPKA